MTRPIHSLRWAVLLAGTGIALLACTRVFRAQHAYAPPAPTGPRIDHESHLDKGLECADCHNKDAKEGEPFDPKPIVYAVCQECHDEEDAEKPEEKKIKNLFFAADGAPRWSRAVEKYDPEIRFRHGDHVPKKDCKVCHGEMKGSERIQGRMFWMDSCMACHLQNSVSNACETCHLQIRQDVAPLSHHHLWKERHGDLAHSKLERQEGRCDLCHTQPQWCEKCHREEPPKSHTNLWRQRTHGVMAAIDRTSCQTCHTTDYCQRCHMETEPRSHRSALWEGTVNTHCAQCHFPIRLEESCRICHRQDPQHDTAPDMPSWHLPSMNCRSCHTPTGNGAPPLLHVDNGMQCTFCHN